MKRLLFALALLGCNGATRAESKENNLCLRIAELDPVCESVGMQSGEWCSGTPRPDICVPAADVAAGHIAELPGAFCCGWIQEDSK